MADYSRNFKTSMTGYLDFNDPDDPKPGKGTMVIYQPKDTIKKISLQDARKINPVTGTPFKEAGSKSLNADPNVIKTIVAHAKAKGVNPYDALAIAYQESGLGSLDSNYGMVNSYFPDESVSNKFAMIDERTRNENANALAKALKDKQEYARRLGYDKKGEEFVLQAYNGYGKLNAPPGTSIKAFYGVPVSPGNPLDMSINPAYGKTVKSLRDDILRKNTEIQQIVDSTPAFIN